MRNEPFTPPPNRWMQAIWRDDRDELVAVPVLIYLWGLVRRNDETMGWALAVWAVGFLVWCLWTAWKVADRDPREDTWRAVATLVYGGVAWLALAPAVRLLQSPWSLAIAFPLIFIPNMWAIVAARRRGRPPLTGARRAAYLLGAAALCATWASLAGALIWAHHARWENTPDFDWLAAPVGALDLAVGVLLLQSAIKGFAPPPAMTTEAILARNP